MDSGYFVPLFREGPKATLSLSRMDRHRPIPAIESVFWPYDERDAPESTITQPKKYGILGLIYYDLFKMRMRIKIQNRAVLALGNYIRHEYEDEYLLEGDPQLYNTAGLRTLVEPYHNPDITDILVEDAATYGTCLDNYAEVRSFGAIGTYILRNWTQAHIAALTAKHQALLDDIITVFLYAHIKGTPGATKRYRSLTANNAYTPQMRMIYERGWNFQVNLASNDFSDMPLLIKASVKSLADGGIKVIP